MILGIIGPLHQDNIALAEAISDMTRFTYVDGNNIIRMLNRNLRLNTCNKRPYKLGMLKVLEEQFHNIIIVSNILLDSVICEQILKQGGIIAVQQQERYSREIEEQQLSKWGTQEVVNYELYSRYKTVHHFLNKNPHEHLFYIDNTSDDVVDTMEELVALMPESTSKCNPQDVYDFIEQLQGKENNDMSEIEELIKKAIADLDCPTNPTETASQLPKEEKSEKPKRLPTPKPKKEFMAPPEPVDKKPEQTEEAQETTGTEDDEYSVFVKVSDGKMAIMFPAEMRLETQEIAGMKFNVATVELPNLDSKKLQELALVNAEKKPVTTKEKEPNEIKYNITGVTVNTEKVAPKETSDTKKKPESKPVKTVTSSPAPSSSDLDFLLSEKKRITDEIAQARKCGDETLVNELRKQRRAIRNQINKLK